MRLCQRSPAQLQEKEQVQLTPQQQQQQRQRCQSQVPPKTQQPPAAAHQRQQHQQQVFQQQQLLQGVTPLTFLMWVREQQASWQHWQPWQEPPHLSQATNN